MEKTLLLWGDTQSGKTTLLTAALSSREDRPVGVSRQEARGEVLRALFDKWTLLRRGRYVPATSDALVDLVIPLDRPDCSVRVRDVRGGLVLEAGQDSVRDAILSADGCLFVLEWSGRDLGRQRLAIEGALPLLREKPCGVVFTKCELALPYHDDSWLRLRRDWWKSGPWGGVDVIERFGDAVWPASAYGFEPTTLRPALVLSEFGRVLPFSVNPRGVWEPFEWMFERLLP